MRVKLVNCVSSWLNCMSITRNAKIKVYLNLILRIFSRCGHGGIFAFIFLPLELLYKALYTKIFKILRVATKPILLLFIALKLLLKLCPLLIRKKNLYSIVGSALIYILIVLLTLLL